MVAIIFSFLSFFSAAQSEPVRSEVPAFADSVRLKKNKLPKRDSTARYLQINRVFILGNRITRDQIILRELTLKTGDLIYSEELPVILESDRKKLLNTRLFNVVDIRMLELPSNQVDLLVDVNERWYTFPSPIFELADRNFNEWWQNYDHDFRRVNYGLRLYQFNMRGRNETLRFIAQFGFQRRFELMYRFPYIDRRQKHGLSVDAGYFETKNLAFRTQDHKYEFAKADFILRSDRFAGVTYTYRKSFYKTHNVKVEHRQTQINDTVKLLNPDFIKGEKTGQEYSSISYMFNADHRDLIAYPLKGYQFTFSIAQSGLFKNEDVKKFETSLIYSRYLDLRKGFYLSNNSVGYYSYPDDLSYINYGVLGQRKQFVRGYELFVVEGPYYVLNKTTFKKQIFSRKYRWADMPLDQFRHIPVTIYLKTYADVAYVRNYPDYDTQKRNTRFSNTLLTGTGMGLDVVSSYDIVLRFEYSFNAQGERGFFFHVKKEF